MIPGYLFVMDTCSTNLPVPVKFDRVKFSSESRYILAFDDFVSSGSRIEEKLDVTDLKVYF